MKSYPQILLVFVVAAHLARARAADIIISEVMYHPVSEDVREEFIELYNRGGEAVNLAGWNFTGGIRFVFSDLLLPPGEFVVVAADVATFRNKHGSAARVAGNWEGMLSNSDEDIDFNDSNGDRADSVHYADEGDWAIRTRGPLDRNHRGWIWVAEHDGGGKSLELINPALSNNRGQNWAASLAAGGTPGRPNSVHRDDLPPMILDARHFPIIPKPSDAVVVTARIEDERRDGLQVFVRHRMDGAANFTRAPMFDDGAHSDGAAGDRYFGAVLPPHSNGTIVEFYFEAIDAGGQVRFWPGPVRPEEQNLANLLYQVRDSNYSSATPLYLLIMREVERAELHALIDDLPDAHTDAQMNGTFISVDAAGTHLQYLVGIRNRGHGSRTARPNNFRVNFPTDQPWQGRAAINLNSQYPHAQLIGSVLFQEAGLPAPDAWIIQLRVNNSNPALTTSPQFDHYVAVEALDTDFTRRHFPGDSAGNVYRGIASDPPQVGEADLVYRGENPDIYRRNYTKETNVSEDNWTDLIELTRVLTQAPAETYSAEVMRVTDVHEWLRYFAINALLDNNETGIYNGYGDDYGLYRGRNNVRFQMLPYDHDTIMGQGFEKGRTDASIFRAANLAVLDRLLRGAEFQPFYVGHLHGMIGTIFSGAQLDPMIDRLLGNWVPATTTSAMKTFAAARNTFVSSAVPSLVPFTAFWRFNGVGADLGADWRQPGFDDSAWPAGKGLLYAESSPLPAPKSTRVPEGRDIYYFRTQFWLHPVTAPLLAGVKLRLTTIIDDGAVIYLNGRELLRVGVPEGQAGHGVFSDRVIGNATLEGPFLLPADALSAGVNILAVELHQSDPQSSDAVFGMTLDLFVPPNPSANHPIQISEVFAHNVGRPAPDGSLADWVELHNPSDSDINLEQLSLTDNSSLPRQWVFPAGARIPARGYSVIRFDSTTPLTSANTGFGLSRSGDEVYLFDRPDRGGLLLDSIRFGIQAPDLSLARNPAGGNQWSLAQPTPGGPNTAVDLGDAGALRINEWMADPVLGPDWFEVFNSSARAIALGGLYLSDSTAARTQFAIAPYSYIAPFQFVKFEADDDPFQGANHLNFKLSAAGETLGIFDGSGNIIDTVTFGSQPTGSSEGRLPDGASTITRFVQATPGASNRIVPVAPRMQIVRRNGSAVIQFPGVTGTSYTIQYCDTVTLAPWLKLKDVAAADTGTQEVIDTMAASTRRFYRIVTPSLP